MFVEICNDGKRIVSTNWWDLPYAKEGYIYVSVNAGAFRILLPDKDQQMLKDMRTAEYVIVTQGDRVDRPVADI